MINLSSILEFPFDLTGLSREGAVAALIVLAALALTVLLVSHRRSFLPTEESVTIIGFARMLQKTATIQLLALAAVLLVAVLAEYDAWPSAGLIVKQSLAVTAYLLLSDWGARQKSFEINASIVPYALIVRGVVIGNGALTIATAPLSHTLALFMASTMTLAAGFFFADMKNL